MACKRSAVRSRLAPPFVSGQAAASPSSRGPGHRPFTAVTGVRIPLGTPIKTTRYGGSPPRTLAVRNQYGSFCSSDAAYCSVSAIVGRYESASCWALASLTPRARGSFRTPLAKLRFLLASFGRGRRGHVYRPILSRCRGTCDPHLLLAKIQDALRSVLFGFIPTHHWRDRFHLLHARRELVRRRVWVSSLPQSADAVEQLVHVTKSYCETSD